MNVHHIQIEFQERQGLASEQLVSAPLTPHDLCRAETAFRKRIADLLQKAVDRKETILEMAGFDNRFLNFPVIGAAKIAAQEILKVAKLTDQPVKQIVLILTPGEAFAVYQETFEGYVRHVQNDLGREPFPTTDIIIELPEGLVLIERSNPPYGWALPGGFLDKGEDPEAGARREAKEETHLDLEDMRFLGLYDKPGRDPRFLTATNVFIAKGVGTPQFGDDAKGLQVIPYEELLSRDYAFDHKLIIQDYLQVRDKGIEG